MLSCFAAAESTEVRSDFKLSGCYILAFAVSAFPYVYYNLFCHNVIQQQGQAECTMHGLCKQHDNHTNLWINIILPTGVMILPFWYEIHTIFGIKFILFFGMKFIPFLVCSV